MKDAVIQVGEVADAKFAYLAKYIKIPLSELPTAIIDGVKGLHNLRSQWVDRYGETNGLTTEVPFLIPRLATFTLIIPAGFRSLPLFELCEYCKEE